MSGIEEGDAAFLARMERASRARLEKLAAQFGWEIGEDGEPWDAWRVFRASEFSGKDDMATVMHKAGFFRSLSEARRNGWAKPILPGDYILRKKRRRVRVIA